MRTTTLIFFSILAYAGLCSGQAIENQYCLKGDVWTGAKADGPAELPQSCVYTGLDGTPSTGTVRQVPDGGNIGTVLTVAKCGDVIQLKAGGTYANFTLPAKACDAGHWITIHTGAPNSALPNAGSRINPSYAGVASLPDRPAFSGGISNVMAKVLAKGGTPAIVAASGANHYRIGPGIELTRPQGTGYVAGIVVLNGADHIIFDRDWIHGSPLVEETTNGVGIGGATNVAVINSYLNDFKCIAGIGKCTDSHAIAGGDTLLTHAEHTWKVYNDFIEAAAENIIHGGGIKGNETPMDLEIRYNHLYKPPSWQNCTANLNCYIVKNLFELKNGSRVLFENNLLEHSWGGYSQIGFGILLTPRGGWAHVQDITIRFNRVSHVGSMMEAVATRSCHNSTAPGNICPTYWEDPAGAGRYSIHDMLFDDVSASAYKGGASTLLASAFQVNPPLHDVALNHITAITNGSDGSILVMGTSQINPQKQMGPFSFTNSIVMAGRYGGIWQYGGILTCVTDHQPVPSFQTCFTGSTVTNNLIIGWTSASWGAWPAGNQTPATPATIFPNGFSLSGGNYHVAPAYQKAASDGTEIGVRLDTLNAALAGVN